MEKGLIAIIAVVVVVMFAGCVEEEGLVSTPLPTATLSPAPEITSAIVSRIIDGDTIELQNGERVRLLGINTPEKGQPYYEEATNRLKELI
ncbi:MAG: hypothetical protein WBC40_09725 [Halobacteriota archaeon]